MRKIKKIITILLFSIAVLSLEGCNKESKVISNSIIIEAKVNNIEPYGYRNGGRKISTTKGNFYMMEEEKSYFNQIEDQYTFKQNNNKDFIIDIIYDNSSLNSDKLYHIKEIVFVD